MTNIFQIIWEENTYNGIMMAMPETVSHWQKFKTAFTLRVNATFEIVFYIFSLRWLKPNPDLVKGFGSTEI